METKDIITNKSIYSDKLGNTNTNFFRLFYDLINHPKLLLSMKNFNYNQEILAKASLFITDYSSKFFDVAYIKKPIIYA